MDYVTLDFTFCSVASMSQRVSHLKEMMGEILIFFLFFLSM